MAYSTPREVYEELIPAFQDTDAGAGVEFEQSYASSGEQSRAVEAGLPADYVAFSLEPDVTRLVDAGLVAPDWSQTEKYNGMVSNSVVVFVVREGNPKGVQTWDDLISGDVEVDHAEPVHVGRRAVEPDGRLRRPARAGQDRRRGGRVPAPAAGEHAGAGQERPRGPADVLGRQGRRPARLRERGDLRAERRPADRVRRPRPDDPHREPRRRDGRRTPAAAAWLEFVQSPDAQRVFGEKGYRPVDPDVAAEFDYPQPSALFTIADLGGWREVRTKFFDRENGIVAGIEQELGVPTDD